MKRICGESHYVFPSLSQSEPEIPCDSYPRYNQVAPQLLIAKLGRVITPAVFMLAKF